MKKKIKIQQVRLHGAAQADLAWLSKQSDKEGNPLTFGQIVADALRILADKKRGQQALEKATK